MNSKFGVCPLELAFRNVELLQFMIRRWPRELEELVIDRPFEVDEDQAILLQHVLPQLKRFHCNFRSWKYKGVLVLVESLRSNASSLVNLSLAVPRAMFATNSELRTSLQEGLVCNKRLSKLDVRVFKENIFTRVGNDDALINGIIFGLRDHPSVKHLTLNGFVTYTKKMSEIFKIGSSFTCLRLKGCSFKSNSWGYSDGKLWERCSVEDLIFEEECEMSHHSLLQLCNNLRWCPHLKVLSLDVSSFEDHEKVLSGNINFTDALVKILTQNQLVDLNLSLKGFNFEVEAILETFKVNNTVQSFIAPFLTWQTESFLTNILEHHNSTLTYVSRDSKQFVSSSPLKFLLLLNSWGKGKAQDPKTSKLTFVKLLEAVVKEKDSHSPSLNKLEMFNIIYGLLRVAPTTWCSPRSKRLVSDIN